MSSTDAPRGRTQLRQGQILLLASGDLRLAANQTCWPAQQAMEKELSCAVAACEHQIVRAHPYKEGEKHGFIGSQREGIEIFRRIDPGSPLIVAEAVWQYSHHVLAGLMSHRGPILTVANWSGQWPGLVGMLNLNGSLTKAGVNYSTLWGEDFSDDSFRSKLRAWLETGEIRHDLSHVTPLAGVSVPPAARELGQKLAAQLQRDKAILGIFDEGCMGMFNAIVPDALLNPIGLFKERLSQSALYYATTKVNDREAHDVFRWYLEQGMRFDFGTSDETDLTEPQVLQQCKMYIAAARIADEFGTTHEYFWVFEISGSVPPSHFIGGWSGARGERQPAMYFRLGGSTIKGVSKPGEIVWSRIYIDRGQMCMDLGRGKVVALPMEETQRRWESTTPQWPIMHAVTYGVSRDQMMAKHKANHIQVAYATDVHAADTCMLAKAAMAEALGMQVNLCGTGKDSRPWT